jgi:hypothetical protein
MTSDMLECAFSFVLLDSFVCLKGPEARALLLEMDRKRDTSGCPSTVYVPVFSIATG